jgi:hypothetical protein
MFPFLPSVSVFPFDIGRIEIQPEIDLTSKAISEASAPAVLRHQNKTQIQKNRKPFREKQKCRA